MCGRYRILHEGVEYWRFFKGGRGQTGRWIDQPLNPADGPEVDPTIQLSLFRRTGSWNSANLITTDPNELLLALPHHRMPVMLITPGEVWAYLEAADLGTAVDLLKSTRADRMA